jgi:hypothetical protein
MAGRSANVAYEESNLRRRPDAAVPVRAGGPQRAEVPVASRQVPPEVVIATDNDAREVRERFETILRRLPPSVGRVLRTDPSLMMNDAYLSTYPSLVAFLKQFPEVRQNGAFYLANVSPGLWEAPAPPDPRGDALRLWRETLQVAALFSGFTIITFTLIWIVRTLVEYRRWYRTSKIQTEVHNKLMDRFNSNEDMLAYIQTPVGRRFLEAAPAPAESPVRPVGAPLSRILWSIQAGVVLAAAAVGLLFVSGRVIEEIAQPMFAIGVLALAVGAGFVVSAFASFLLSRRLGLLEAPPAAAREHSAGVSGS